MKGQVSTELLMIVAAILVLFIPLLVITYFKAAEANEQVMQLQAQVVAIRLSELANAIGSASGQSAVKAEVYIPATVTSLSIIKSGGGGELILNSSTQTGANAVVGIIRYPVKEYAGDQMFIFNNAGLVRFEITKELNSAGTEELVFKRLETTVSSN